MDVVVAPIHPGQIAEAKEVIRAVWREHLGTTPEEFVRTHFGGDNAFPDLDAFEALYVAPHGLFLVATDGARVVGTGGIRRADGDTAELGRMFLLPEYRGRGIGRRIAERLIGFAREAGYRRVRLGTHRELTASHALYRKLGFREIPAYEPGGEGYAQYMELVL